MEYISALIVGLVGSLHCAGMCGPIAIAIPLNNSSWLSRISGTLLYNTGRTLTYALLGAIFGLAGLGLALGGLQQWVSIALGIVMILSVLIPKVGAMGKSVTRISNLATSQVKKLFGKYFRVRTYTSLFILGLLNGLLPCGLVYIALAGALVMSHVYEGALYMVFFGLGTIPMMMALSLAGNVISGKLRTRLNRFLPYFIVLLGIIFILRGMNLGIPYLSPKINKTATESTMECCHPKK
jgi:sulfite exporter TauE/SafE